MTEDKDKIEEKKILEYHIDNYYSTIYKVLTLGNIPQDFLKYVTSKELLYIYYTQQREKQYDKLFLIDLATAYLSDWGSMRAGKTPKSLKTLQSSVLDTISNDYGNNNEELKNKLKERGITFKMTEEQLQELYEKNDIELENKHIIINTKNEDKNNDKRKDTK